MTRSFAVAVGKYVLGLVVLACVMIWYWSPADGSPGLSDAFLKPLNFGALLAAAVCTAISVTTQFTRWFGLVRAQELPFTLYSAWRLGMVAYFFNTVLPGSIGGDIVKAIGLAREQSRRTVAIATVVFDRLVGLWGLIWLVSIFGAAFWFGGADMLRENRGLMSLVRITWAVLGATLLAWLALGFVSQDWAHRCAERLDRGSKVSRSLAEAWRAIWMYRCKPRAVAAALGLSLLSQVFFVLAFHWAARVFAGDVDVASLEEHALVVPPGMVVQALFPAPGGVGGGEFGFGKLYALLGRPESRGILASLALRMISLWLGVIGFVIYMQMKRTLPSDSDVREKATAADPA